MKHAFIITTFSGRGRTKQAHNTQVGETMNVLIQFRDIFAWNEMECMNQTDLLGTERVRRRHEMAAKKRERDGIFLLT